MDMDICTSGRPSNDSQDISLQSENVNRKVKETHNSSG